MQSYTEVSGHRLQSSQKFEMTQRGYENPVYNKQSESRYESYYGPGGKPTIEMQETSYEHSSNAPEFKDDTGKGVLSLSKAFEDKSKIFRKPVQDVSHRQRGSSRETYQSKTIPFSPTPQVSDYQSKASDSYHHMQESVERSSYSMSGSSSYQHQADSFQASPSENVRLTRIEPSQYSPPSQSTGYSHGYQKSDFYSSPQADISSQRHIDIHTNPQSVSAHQPSLTFERNIQFQPSYTPSSQSSMRFHVPGSSAYDMTAFVKSPSGSIERCQVVDLDDNNYSIKFVPKEMGIHSVSVRHRDIDIPGSPFEFSVGPVAGGGAMKIQAYGAGLYGGVINEINKFEIFTREAGAGSLSVAVEGPVKAEIDFYDKKDGTCVVSYVCPEPGEYRISIKFNDIHVPGSPFMANITSPHGDHLTPLMCSLQPSGHEMNKPLTFTVDMTGRKGRLDAYVRAPSGAEEACTLHESDRNTYSIRFTPNESGIHWVHVRYNGREIPDSPFQVHVKQNISDPSKVFASGAGLYHGETGSLCEFFIDTASAGAGPLAVTVDGPSKVQIDCDEVPNGYKASFIPTMPGSYVVSIKFADVHINGSPFHCRVYGSASDKINITRPLYTSPQPIHLEISESYNLDKVCARGTGLSRAFVNDETHFTVDTQDAGRSVLTVSLQGPRKPTKDIQVKRLSDNLYDVCYTLGEPGIYKLTVKWGDHHIRGSPFTISAV